ncbi:hypothetical protein QC760_001377 [Botrytis cinerea]
MHDDLLRSYKVVGFSEMEIDELMRFGVSQDSGIGVFYLVERQVSRIRNRIFVADEKISVAVLLVITQSNIYVYLRWRHDEFVEIESLQEDVEIVSDESLQNVLLPY